MAKEKEEPKKGERKAKKHLHEMRITQAEDGSLVHHHTYKKKATDEHPEPERGPMATSTTPEEAGQHVAEQFGMNGMGGGGDDEQAEGEGGGAPAPAAGATPEAE